MSDTALKTVSLIDIGNSNIVIAVARGDEILRRLRLPTELRWTTDLYEITLRAAINGDAAFADSTQIALASTVPALTERVGEAAERVFGRPISNLNRQRGNLGIGVDIDAPNEAGVDRIVNALAARTFHGAPAIVVDIGTATTFDVVGKNGAYVGGAIAAGPALSLESLHKVAAQLPTIDIRRPEKVIGRSTLGAMYSGFYWAYVGMIQFMCRKIAEELEEEASAIPIIVSGGYAEAFVDSFDMPALLDSDITLKGMLLALRHLHDAKGD